MPPAQASSAPTAPAVDAPFAPPKVEIGQVVLWSDGAEAKACPAVVLKVGTGGVLTLALHIDGIKDHIFRTGVRNQEDPWLRKFPEHRDGAWRLTERDIQLNRLLKENE